MFNSLCHYLNRMGLSRQVAAVREWLYAHGPTTYRQYDHSDKVGYLGWFEVPALGVIAFVRPDESLQFEW